MAIIIYDMPQRSEAWFKIREGRWTGSTAKYLLQGKPLPAEDTFWDGKGYAARGRVLEDLAIEAYEMTERGYTGFVERCGFIINTRYTNAGCSPDGLIEDEEILYEVKCFALPKHNAIVADDIPLDVMIQIQFNLAITGFKHCVLIAYNPDAPTPLYYKIIKPIRKSLINIRKRLNETKKLS